MFVRSSLFYVGCVAFAAVASTIAAEPTKQSLGELRKAKQLAAEKWLQSMEISLGGYIPDFEKFNLPAAAIRDAELDLATTPEKRIAALKRYVETLVDYHRIVKELHDDRQGGGEARKLHRCEYYLLEAQINLRLEEAKK